LKLIRNTKLHPALLLPVPLINVLFLVVIFFALSSRFALQPGFAVTLPGSSFALPPQREPQIISITTTPVPAIYHREQKVSLEELAARLRETRSKERSVIIKADRDSSYDLVVQVMNHALQQGFSVVLAANPAGE
jgi:biopolymer transport protein ExbD